MEQSKSLLVVKASTALTNMMRAKIAQMMEPIAERCGCEVLVADESFDASIHSDIRPLLEAQLEQQRKTNELLLTLIEALGEEESEDPDARPETYMDGTKIR